MQALKEAISVRVARINSEITGKSSGNNQLLHREILLDALQVLYDECSVEGMQKTDSNIAEFVKKYQEAIKDIKTLRINISDFEIKNVIGCGHFGEVHLVKEKQTGDVYAMKTIRKFDQDTKRMSFQEERNIMALSNSPWITKLQYSFQDSSYLFYVMEYHPGGDLLGLLYRKGGTLPESAAIFYIAQVALALEDLHKMGYVHRDVKPDNILLDRCGHIKLADFGSATKLDNEGLVKAGPPVGTPDYIAPEVLQCLDNKSSEKFLSYGVSCDYWSLGVLAYELTIGNPPFQGQNSTTVYSKIMNHRNSLKFPSDISLSVAYVSFIKGLITDVKSRLKPNKIKAHALFKGTNFDTLRDQVPPYVPKIDSMEDTRNFSDVQAKKKHPSIENFKRRSQFSGRNLPFIGFTFTHQPAVDTESVHFNLPLNQKIELENLKTELNTLRMQASKSDDVNQEKQDLERKLEECSIKLQSVEALRDKLEQQLAESLAESSAVKRTLDVERKERTNLEKKALDLIKGAKLKWERSEKAKVEALDLEIQQLKSKNEQLINTNKTLNEQLQHVIKIQESDRQSLETEKNLSRRSVLGLENLLDKVTAERQNQITELQSKLNEEVSNTTNLQNEITHLKTMLTHKENEMDSLRHKLSRSKTQYEVVQDKLDDNVSLLEELNSKVNELERDLQKIDQYKEEMLKLRDQFDNSQKTIKDLENKNQVLQSECKVLEETKLENTEMKRKTAELEKQLGQLEKAVEEERELCDSLKKKLQDKEMCGSKSQELREKQLELYKLQKELSDCKIDKRILERELKDAKGEIKQLEVKLANSKLVFDDSRKTHEAAMLELSNMNENLSMELIKAKQSVQSLQELLQNENNKIEDEKAVIKELKSCLQSKTNAIRDLENQLRDAQSELVALNSKCLKEEQEKAKLTAAIEQLKKEKMELNESIGKGQTEISNLKLNLDALREACILLEEQVIEYEKLVEISKVKQTELSGNTEKLISDLCEARRETQEAKRHVNEEKSLRAMVEQKVRRLEEDLQSLEKECDDYKTQCAECKQFMTGLSDELNASEEKLSNAEVTVKAYERQIEKLTKENNVLKEELSSHITKISHLKESKYKLTHQVSDLTKTLEGQSHKLKVMENALNEQLNYYKEREIKADARDKQHLKLIDYLQSKIEEQSHKKKTLTEVLFGSSNKKENQPPISLALNYKDLEAELTKEKENNRKLTEEVFKLKASALCEVNSNILERTGSKMEKCKSEILTPRSKAAMEQIVTSPSRQKSASIRMHHNIPHRFETKINTTSQKCHQCHNHIQLGRNSHVCKECHVTAHVTCSQGLPKVCGLPKQLADHYKSNLRDAEVPEKVENESPDSALCEGWIKIACSKSGSWEKRYARLTDSSLDIYTESPIGKSHSPIDKFPFTPHGAHGKVVLEPLPSEIGIPVANSDLPFVMKVEVTPDTTCWPAKCLVIMALSVKDKESWFSALQKCFASVQVDSKFKTLFKSPPSVVVNCLIELDDNIKVLATDRGLFSYYEDTLLRIEGVDNIEQISVFGPANAVLMIEGSKSTLIACDISHLINLSKCASCIKPTLKFKQLNVNNLNGFHILQVSKHRLQKKVAVATPKQLLILEYYSDTNEFLPVRLVDTAQPTACLLFTQNSLLVGADKFFEIDLNLFQAEEFLDASDVKLKQALACHKIGSFPVAVMETCSNPKEYLLVFNEFLVFVDEFGRASRDKEISNHHLPLAVHLADRSFLYIVQFGAIEVMKITAEVCVTADLETQRVILTKFKYLGGNSKGIFVEAEGEVKFFTAKNLPDFDALSLASDGTEVANDSNSSRFSFTSSIVQSLDGNLSDNGDRQDAPKVRFDQTDL